MEKSTFNTSENEKFTTIGNAKLSPELIRELENLQDGNNAGINEDIDQLNEVIDFIVCIHKYGKEAMIKKRMLDSIASLSWVIGRYKILKAPPVGTSKKADPLAG